MLRFALALLTLALFASTADAGWVRQCNGRTCRMAYVADTTTETTTTSTTTTHTESHAVGRAGLFARIRANMQHRQAARQHRRAIRH